ncbi:hypothetical protein LTR37_020827 [Vermiconidia calcicola]|uniref:Uncharacterized protein n=1 Tax=Vermiconidia calcicola TaxID=1690605 RepID=A0ACC3MD67_9PEZI|nr:hypothetical protein LTR37_020827 [Vermiconidia calcicola]
MGSMGDDAHPDYDVLIVGAGLSGCYSLYRMREQKLKTKVLEAGSGPGGTWYWNRYPGARFDCESYSYGFSWSQEVLDEFDWTEHFAPQPETERYINFVCDKFGLKEDMQFETRIQSAQFLEGSRIWQLNDDKGRTYTSRWLITGMGVLSNPTLPNLPGVSDFKGTAYHTARWPAEPVDFTGKRVGIIGTGATSIQAIPEICKTVGDLTVFQRTPNWAIPLHNKKIAPDEMKKIREGYPELFRRCAETKMSFIHEAGNKKTTDATAEERELFWEDLYGQPGFGLWVSNYTDIGLDKAANKLISDFVEKKIRQRVHDQKTADMLIPKNHGFGTRRVPMETHYFEAYNQPNVHLVDINATPIERITEKGVKTSEGDFEFDMIIYATGFDAVTGAFDAVSFTGMDGVTLKETWNGGPKTYLGLTAEHFPNMFMIMGPHQMYGNIPRSIEFAVEWVSNCIEYCRAHDVTWVEAKGDGVEMWTNHVHEVAKGLLSNEIDSWMTGVNKNVAGKQKRTIARYSGSAQEFRRVCNKVADDRYNTMLLA